MVKVGYFEEIKKKKHRSPHYILACCYFFYFSLAARYYAGKALRTRTLAKQAIFAQ